MCGRGGSGWRQTRDTESMG
ncbi:unnamed protein product [Medioppia subpectinata]|uniref:Uncharacterized protein n=1 Tax=Medioppia subpectinata TaxID=1979941 RepID=A0A7R9KQB1_9ACAR|nr:unnamed protein product [Medioppia subpectinata]CAG2107566.1 unnamed protein product [Medioppia subpectinata]